MAGADALRNAKFWYYFGHLGQFVEFARVLRQNTYTFVSKDGNSDLD